MGCFESKPAPGPQIPSSLKINWDDIRIEKDGQIGQGGFGKVYKGMWQGNRVAVKVLSAERMNDENRRHLLQEAVLMSRLSHPCVARVFGVVDESDHLALVMCYYRRGTLEEFMTQPATRLQYQELDVLTRVSMALQVAKGVSFLHSRGVLHGDIKTSNLLLDEQKRVYLTDFGLARELTGGSSSQPQHRYAPQDASATLSVHISPPEVLEQPHAPRSTPVDIYALGVVLLEIMSGQPAFRMTPQMIRQVVLQGKRPAIPADVPPSVHHVIQLCWAQNPADRPPASAVVDMLDTIRNDIVQNSGIAYDESQYTKMV